MAGKQTTTAAATSTDTAINPSFPVARVKKIVKIDKDISRVSSEAFYLISGAAELFLHFLAAKSSDVVAEKKRKTIKLDDLRIAVKRHQPTREFLLDSLPPPTQVAQPSGPPRADRTVKEKPVPAHTRRIDSFFKKPAIEQGSVHVDDVTAGSGEDVDDVIMEERADDVDDEIANRVEDVDVVMVEPVEDVDDEIVKPVEDVDDVSSEERIEEADDEIAKRVEDVDDVCSEERVEDVDEIVRRVEDVDEIARRVEDADDVTLVDEV